MSRLPGQHVLGAAPDDGAAPGNALSHGSYDFFIHTRSS